MRSLNYLKATLKQIHEKQDSPTDPLKVELEKAVDDEDYERAAELRDRIRDLEAGAPRSSPEDALPEE